MRELFVYIWSACRCFAYGLKLSDYFALIDRNEHKPKLKRNLQNFPLTAKLIFSENSSLFEGE